MFKIFLFILFFSSLFTGCSLDNKIPNRTIYFISIALDYKNTNVNFLSGSLNDGKEIDKAFKLNSQKTQTPFYDYCFYQEGTSHDKQTIENRFYPTKEHIFNCIEEISEKINDNDLLIISYSGHGLKENGSWLLGTEDITTGKSINLDLEINKEQLISPTEILNKLSNLNGNKLLLIDACFSEFFKPESDLTTDISIEGSCFIKEMENFFSNDLANNSNIYILCASEKNNYSHEPSVYITQHCHGYFSEALLEGIGWSYGIKGDLDYDPNPSENIGIKGFLYQGFPPASYGNNILTLDDLYNYIKTHQDISLKKQENLNSHQYPRINGGRNNLILFKY